MLSKPLEARILITQLPSAYVGGEKIKTDGLKTQTPTDVITH